MLQVTDNIHLFKNKYWLLERWRTRDLRYIYIYICTSYSPIRQRFILERLQAPFIFARAATINNFEEGLFRRNSCALLRPRPIARRRLKRWLSCTSQWAVAPSTSSNIQVENILKEIGDLTVHINNEANLILHLDNLVNDCVNDS